MDATRSSQPVTEEEVRQRLGPDLSQDVTLKMIGLDRCPYGDRFERVRITKEEGRALLSCINQAGEATFLTNGDLCIDRASCTELKDTPEQVRERVAAQIDNINRKLPLWNFLLWWRRRLEVLKKMALPVTKYTGRAKELLAKNNTRHWVVMAMEPNRRKEEYLVLVNERGQYDPAMAAGGPMFRIPVFRMEGDDLTADSMRFLRRFLKDLLDVAGKDAAGKPLPMLLDAYSYVSAEETSGTPSVTKAKEVTYKTPREFGLYGRLLMTMFLNEVHVKETPSDKLIPAAKLQKDAQRFLLANVWNEGKDYFYKVGAKKGEAKLADTAKMKPVGFPQGTAMLPAYNKAAGEAETGNTEAKLKALRAVITRMPGFPNPTVSGKRMYRTAYQDVDFRIARMEPSPQVLLVTQKLPPNLYNTVPTHLFFYSHSLVELEEAVYKKYMAHLERSFFDRFRRLLIADPSFAKNVKTKLKLSKDSADEPPSDADYTHRVLTLAKECLSLRITHPHIKSQEDLAKLDEDRRKVEIDGEQVDLKDHCIVKQDSAGNPQAIPKVVYDEYAETRGPNKPSRLDSPHVPVVAGLMQDLNAHVKRTHSNYVSMKDSFLKGKM